MKKIYVLFAIISLFVLQLCYVRPIYAVNDGNIDLDSDKYNNVESANSITYSCGSRMVKDIPSTILDTVHIGYMIIQVVVPVILVVTGMITLLKSVTAGKEDEIKKAQMTFVKKLIVGALVFFIFVIVKLLVSFSATSDRAPKIVECMDCFLNGKENCDVSLIDNFITRALELFGFSDM